MANDVYFMLEVEIQAGQESNARTLMRELSSAAEANEPGTLNYTCSVSADGKRSHFFERYTDSEAAMTHLGTFVEKFAGRFLEVFKITGLTVYGSPSAAVKEALAGFSPVYMERVVGFGR